MVRSRTLTALVGLALSLLASVVAWVSFDVPFLFLLVPFVPFLFRFSREEPASPPMRECPACGFRTPNPEFEYCPRDGNRLEVEPGAGTPPTGRDRASMK